MYLTEAQRKCLYHKPAKIIARDTKINLNLTYLQHARIFFFEECIKNSLNAFTHCYSYMMEYTV